MNQRMPDFGNTANLRLHSCQIAVWIPESGNRDLTSDSCSRQMTFCPGRVGRDGFCVDFGLGKKLKEDLVERVGSGD